MAHDVAVIAFQDFAQDVAVLSRLEVVATFTRIGDRILVVLGPVH